MTEPSIEERLQTIEDRLSAIDRFQAKYADLAEEKACAYKQLYESQREQRIKYRDENARLRREIKQLKNNCGRVRE